jgi:putative holliday junction resolvase
MRILAIDYGERRTGLAVSDPLGITAQGLPTIETKDSAGIPARVAEIIAEVGAEQVIIGLPLNMNGTESDQTAAVRTFAAEVETLVDIPVIFRDERLTSVQAHRVMREMGTKTRGNKHVVDRISATLILQDYLTTIS